MKVGVWRKIDVGGDDKLGIKLAWPKEVQMYAALSSVCSSLGELVAMSLRLSVFPDDS